MTAGRAAILKVLSIYREMLYPLSQLEVQKLVYFLSRAGQDFAGLKFEKNTYGPFAPALRHVLTKMDGAYLQGVGDGTTRSEIFILPAALAEADEFLLAHRDTDTSERVSRVSRLIAGFETAYGMELLATVHWAAVADGPPSEDPAEILARVRAWNARKRSLMTSEHVRAAHKRLLNEGWLH